MDENNKQPVDHMPLVIVIKGSNGLSAPIAVLTEIAKINLSLEGIGQLEEFNGFLLTREQGIGLIAELTERLGISNPKAMS